MTKLGYKIWKISDNIREGCQCSSYPCRCGKIKFANRVMAISKMIFAVEGLFYGRF